MPDEHQSVIAGKSAEPATNPLSEDELRRIDAYWRAANYLSVGQIYLLDNPLLTEPLRLEHIKPRGRESLTAIEGGMNGS